MIVKRAVGQLKESQKQPDFAEGPVKNRVDSHKRRPVRICGRLNNSLNNSLKLY